MMAQMKVHGISDKVMGLSSPRTMFFISLEPVKVFCQICPTRFFKDQKDPVFQGLTVNLIFLYLLIFDYFIYFNKNIEPNLPKRKIIQKDINIFNK